MRSDDRFRIKLTATRIVGLLFMMICLAGAGLGHATDNPPKDGGEERYMGHGDASKIVVARVNGTEINMAMLMNKMFDLAQQKYGRKEISPLVAQKIKGDATNELILEELAYQKAYAAIGDIKKEQLDKAIAELTANYGGEKAFQAYLDKEKITLSAYRRKVAKTLVVKFFLKQEFDDKIKVNDAEITAAYKGAKNKYFVQHEQVQVTDITLFMDPDSSEGVAGSKAFKKKIINKYDNDPFKIPKDGTFAIMKDINLNKVTNSQLYEAARVLGDHGVSEPINVNGTLHIVQLTGYKPDITKTLDDARKYLTKELKKRKRQALVQQWVAGLKEGAKIEVVDLSE